jgi:hypothetical protein
MSMSTLISGLKGLAHNTELIINAFCFSDTQPTKEEYTFLTALGVRFSKVIIIIIYSYCI